MKLWHTVSSLVLFSIAASAATSGDIAAGKKVHTGKCARCHKLYDPFRYDEKTWDSWMQKMKSKARLSDEQYRQLIEYYSSLPTKK